MRAAERAVCSWGGDEDEASASPGSSVDGDEGGGGGGGGEYTPQPFRPFQGFLSFGRWGEVGNVSCPGLSWPGLACPFLELVCGRDWCVVGSVRRWQSVFFWLSGGEGTSTSHCLLASWVISMAVIVVVASMVLAVKGFLCVWVVSSVYGVWSLVFGWLGYTSPQPLAPLFPSMM